MEWMDAEMEWMGDVKHNTTDDDVDMAEIIL